MFRIFAPIIALLLISCSENSALNDTDVTKPGIISPSISIEKNYTSIYNADYGKSVNETIEARIFDRNNDYVRIENGSISVNGVLLSEKRTFIGKYLFYALDRSEKMPYEPGKTYNFIITLEDGVEYKGSVVTPLAFSFSAPVSVKKGADIPLQINAGNVGDAATANLTLHFRYMKNNILKDTTVTAYHTITIGSDKNLNLVVPASKLSYSTLFLAEVGVTVSRKGTLDSRFKSPSIGASRDLGRKNVVVN